MSVCPFCQTVGIQVKGLVTDGIFSVTIPSGLFFFIYRSVYLLVFVRFSFCSFVLFLFYLHSGWSYRDEFCFAVFFGFFFHIIQGLGFKSLFRTDLSHFLSLALQAKNEKLSQKNDENERKSFRKKTAAMMVIMM